MQNINRQVESMDRSIQVFVVKFETTFARYFLDACWDYDNGTLPANSPWTTYFTAENLPSWKRILLGANTHINIDIWPSMVYNFSADEIKRNKKQFLSLQRAVAKVHEEIFDTVLAHSGYLRFINFITLRLDKNLAERILFKWRKRNINLAIWFYEKPGKFRRKWEQVQRKKKRTDLKILRSGPKQKPG